MSRTRGSKDLKKRKQRKFYAGKRIKKRRKKHGRYVIFTPVKEKKQVIKLWFWEERPMSYDGYLRIPNHLRRYMTKKIYKPLIRVDSHVSRISNPEKVGELAINVLGKEGVFLMKGFSHGTNRYHVKNITLCKIKIKETSQGLRAEVFDTTRIYRYWWWQK